MEVTIVEVEGLALRVGTSTGRPGSTPLLMFNGLGADLDFLRPLVDELERLGIGVVTFDVPGIGGSSIPALPYRFGWMADIAEHLLRHLGVGENVDVGGMSWGGALAQEFAHRHPRRVRRLVLAATSAGAVALPGRLSALMHLFDIRLYLDRDYLERFGGDLYGGKLREDARSLHGYAVAFRPLGCYFQLLAVTGWTSIAWLPSLTMPTLILAGIDDPIVPPANARVLASLIPDARLETFADGHLFLLTSVAESAPVIADFLGQPPAAADAAVGEPTCPRPCSSALVDAAVHVQGVAGDVGGLDG